MALEGCLPFADQVTCYFLLQSYMLPVHSGQAFSPVCQQLVEEAVFWEPFLLSKCKGAASAAGQDLETQAFASGTSRAPASSPG